MIYFSVYDNLSGVYGLPVLFHNVSEAERWFSALVNNPDANNLVHSNPGDFSLYKLGTFDERTGVLTQDYQKINNASSYLRPMEKGE